MIQRSEYQTVEQLFRSSTHGETLSQKLRYDKYRHPSVSHKQWIDLLGRDVNNLEHLSLTRGIALGFVRYSQEHQPDLLTDDEAATLPLIASIHDWGEAITGDISFGDKTADNDVEEAHALDVVATEIYANNQPPELLDAAKAVVFDHEGQSKLGKIFFAIECLGYMRTAVNAANHVSDQTCPDEQVAGMQWLYTDVVSNVMVTMLGHAKEYAVVHAALMANADKIDQTFDLIASHDDVFDNYDDLKRLGKVEAVFNARTAWEQFKTQSAQQPANN